MQARFISITNTSTNSDYCGAGNVDKLDQFTDDFATVLVQFIKTADVFAGQADVAKSLTAGKKLAAFIGHWTPVAAFDEFVAEKNKFGDCFTSVGEETHEDVGMSGTGDETQADVRRGGGDFLSSTLGS